MADTRPVRPVAAPTTPPPNEGRRASTAYERGIFDAGRAAGRREAFESELAQAEGCAAVLDGLAGQEDYAAFYRIHAEHVRAVLAQEPPEGDAT